MPGLTIPGLELLRQAKTFDENFAQTLYLAMKQLLDAQNRIPIIVGQGHPEGAVAAKPGTLFIPIDPLMGECLYVKVSGEDVNGWISIATSYSGSVQAARKITGTTASAVYVALQPAIQITVPPNCNQMNYTVSGIAGNGKCRVKIGTHFSNERTANGTVTVNGLDPGPQDLEFQGLAVVPNFTATLEIMENTIVVGTQLSGNRATPAGGSVAGGTPNPSGQTGSGSGESGDFGDACVVEGTKVLTPVGWLPVEFAAACITHEGTVEAVISNEAVKAECIAVDVEGFPRLECSLAHPLLDHEMRCVSAGKFFVGALVLTDRGTSPISGLYRVGEKTVRRISLAGPLKTYKVAGGIWSHNVKPNFEAKA